MWGAPSFVNILWPFLTRFAPILAVTTARLLCKKTSALHSLFQSSTDDQLPKEEISKISLQLTHREKEGKVTYVSVPPISCMSVGSGKFWKRKATSTPNVTLPHHCPRNECLLQLFLQLFRSEELKLWQSSFLWQSQFSNTRDIHCPCEVSWTAINNGTMKLLKLLIPTLYNMTSRQI